MKMAVATFHDKNKAEEVRVRLEECGIPAEVYDESKVQKFWFMSEHLAGEKVRVDEKDFERARVMLAGLDATEQVLKFAVRCPECNSSRIEYPQFTRKFVTPTLVEIFTVLAPGMKKRFYCEDCHCTWAPEAEAEPAPWDGSKDLDSLGWPRKK
jgi:predicted Zn-ribbon and HTH transcriptional regulator